MERMQAYAPPGAGPNAGVKTRVRGVSVEGLDAWKVGICLLLWLGATAGLRPLMLPDEGRYVSVAWEMLRSGDWLTPTLNGLPFFHKPPLFYWITASALQVFGPQEWVGRCASLLGGWMAGMSIYLFTRHWVGREVARRALVLLAALPMLYLGAQYANLDSLVAGCIVATIMALAHAALCFEQGQRYRRMVWLGYALAALGVLAKGLIGAALPALVIGGWLLARGRWRTLVALISVPGILLFAVLVVPWFWAMQQRFPEFLNYFFVLHHVQRFAVGGFNNGQPWWFFPALLGALAAPFALCAVHLWRWSYWRDAAQPQRSAVRQLMAWNVVGVVLFFSIPPSKLVGYVMPAVPALAWLLADASADFVRAAAWRRWWWRGSLVAWVALSWTVIGLLVGDEKHSAKGLGNALAEVHRGSEPVYIVGKYLYDTGFYAQLPAPVHVVDPWEPERRDNWRKELQDAGAFDQPRAAQLLVPSTTWAERLCGDGTSWVIADPQAQAQFPGLAQGAPLYQSPLGWLWKVDLRTPAARAAWGCSAKFQASPA